MKRQDTGKTDNECSYGNKNESRMGSYKQWFDRKKLKEIFRVHGESLKDRFPRYREERYEEAE
jgi:hypothetical protein